MLISAEELTLDDMALVDEMLYMFSSRTTLNDGRIFFTISDKSPFRKSKEGKAYMSFSPNEEITVVRNDHVWMEDDDPDCIYNQISVCEKCGLLEGCLTTECPGEESYKEYSDMVYEGTMDFRNGEWLEACSIHSPEFYRKLQEN